MENSPNSESSDITVIGQENTTFEQDEFGQLELEFEKVYSVESSFIYQVSEIAEENGIINYPIGTLVASKNKLTMTIKGINNKSCFSADKSHTRNISVNSEQSSTGVTYSSGVLEPNLDPNY